MVNMKFNILNQDKKKKISKDIQLTSQMASFFDSELNFEEEVSTTQLAKSIIFPGNKHPHVHTVEGELRKMKIHQEQTPFLQFIENRETGKISRVRKVKPSDMTFKEEIRREVLLIKEQIDSLKHSIETLIKLNKKNG